MDKNKISGICCDVENCVHNHKGCECTADSIQVCSTCSDPNCCDETICKTFKPCDGCH
ncbi:MAG: DUF1540 domain-containing protein [Ruminococcus sp.]|uniref:DUF1540 domain-containing protein n=1 Tax=Ruminococcus sp. TaxID=41978 RepID=UPI0025D73E46|nr:DUF1540 domain-containing protein [Ruminococcus sp.]MCR5539996.1 DUF1540 domain-containing protein [Ruminococcus sp.]